MNHVQVSVPRDGGVGEFGLQNVRRRPEWSAAVVGGAAVVGALAGGIAGRHGDKHPALVGVYATSPSILPALAGQLFGGSKEARDGILMVVQSVTAGALGAWLASKAGVKRPWLQGAAAGSAAGAMQAINPLLWGA